MYGFLLAAPELGVRMMSPVGKMEIADATKSADFEANKASTDYFDTYITIRALSHYSQNRRYHGGQSKKRGVDYLRKK